MDQYMWVYHEYCEKQCFNHSILTNLHYRTNEDDEAETKSGQLLHYSCVIPASFLLGMVEDHHQEAQSKSR